MANGSFSIGAVVAEIKADISDFKKGFSEVTTQVKGFGGHIEGVSNQLNNLIKIGAAGAVAMAGFIGKKAVDEAATYEQQVIALNTLLGSTEKATAHIAKIKEDALKTPFNVQGLITANQLLISAGIEAGKAERDILNLGDAISANGKGAVELDRIIVNLQQIKNVGKATEMDMRQFAFNGINMYQLLADSTNLPIAQLKDMDINYEMITEALAVASAEGGKYHDANLRQSESLIGLKSNLWDTAQQQLVNIANQTGLFDATKAVTGELIKWVNDVSPLVIEALRSFGEKIQATIDFLKEHKLQVEILTAFLVGFFLPAIIAVGVQSTITAVVGMAKLIASTIMFGIEGWKVVAMMLVKIAQFTIATAVFIAHTAATVAQTAASVALTAATWLLNAALVVLTSPIFLIILAIGALIAIGVLLYKNWDKVKETGQIVLDYVAKKWNEFVDVLKDVGKRILDAIMWPFNEAKKKIEDAVGYIKDKLDFTKRNSPSVMDILNHSVKLANDAMGDLMSGVNMSSPAVTAGAVMATNSGGGAVTQISIDMGGAIISDEAAAMEFGERMGDSIIRKLQMNVRA